MGALDLVDGWPAPHASVAIVRAGAVVEQRGPADRPYAWASVTKLVTAVAVLVALEEEAIGIDEPAGPPGSSVRHLLAHASGLAPDRREALAAPGERRIYSNAGFEVLADLVAEATGIAFADYLAEAALGPLAMKGATLDGSPASGLTGTLDDLVALADELLAPRVLADETLREATQVEYPGLAGVLPGFGPQDPNDWGLGFELRGAKSPHWTGHHNSPRTFGHFGRSGTFLWVDPEPRLALACLTDHEFGPWAAEHGPALADAVLEEHA